MQDDPIASTAELITRLRAEIERLDRDYPTQMVRVIVSTCPMAYPDTDEDLARPVILDRQPAAASRLRLVSR